VRELVWIEGRKENGASGGGVENLTHVTGSLIIAVTTCSGGLELATFLVNPTARPMISAKSILQQAPPSNAAFASWLFIVLLLLRCRELLSISSLFNGTNNNEITVNTIDVTRHFQEKCFTI
jgi:hypothetical protein